MPKPRRKENKGLPERWTAHHGAYYYYVPKGMESAWEGKKKYKLGNSLPEAYAKYAEMVDVKDKITTVGELLDRYVLEVVPTKAKATQNGNHAFIKRLRATFSETPLLPFHPQRVYQYVQARKAKVSAHREVEILSHAYTKAVEWGLIAAHPFKGEVRLEGEASRSRYVEDWEVIEFFSLDSKRKKGSVLMIQAYVKLKLLTGMSQGDLLRLQIPIHKQDDGIHIMRHKTAKKAGIRTIYAWTPALKSAWEQAVSARPCLSSFLFCNAKGKGYVNEEKGTQAGFKSMWQRYMARLLKETDLKEPFTEHDLRAKVGSDAKSLEHAMMLLSHADPRTTQKTYRRKAVLVNPLQ
ncbi:tyrosine-type recombinase/integrase [Methylophilus flavus]|uniref:Tyrosine-type recombinase/integrase n=1 Tax=Methylophilus flavus TaxID=640084 RepID=A0ABW3P7F9_9PROT